MDLRTGRNDPCWCGSGKKFKRCHWPDQGLQTKQERAAFGSFGTSVRMQSISSTPKKDVNKILSLIENQRKNGTRPLPSGSIQSIGDRPVQEVRKFLLDTCAKLVDENWCGRSEMCIYFAVLIRHGLNIIGIPANVHVGKAIYIDNNNQDNRFEWDHAWVVQEEQLIDGNIDSIIENPMVPNGISPAPYWGPIEETPSDRKLYSSRILDSSQDEIELDKQEITMWKQHLEITLKDKFSLG